MITAKDLKDIADQNQCTQEEKNIIKTILDYCKIDAIIGEYKSSFNAVLHISNYPSLQNAIIYIDFLEVQIAYIKLKNQLTSLGFHLELCKIGNLLTNKADNNYQQKIIITISWGE